MPEIPTITHATRPGGPTGLDATGTPKQASNDTLISLAKEYGVPWEAIAQATFETTDPAAIAVQLRDQGFGVLVGNDWLMAPGLNVTIPKGEQAPGDQYKYPVWAKAGAAAGLGLLAAWIFQKFMKDEEEDEPEAPTVEQVD